MPRTGPSAGFVPLQLPDHLTGWMPEPVAARWAGYQAAVLDWRRANKVARDAKAAADAAPHEDQVAATAAVKAGKPVPSATAAKKADAAEKALRVVEAHIRIALEAERAYLSAASEHRDAWLTTAYATAVAAAAAAGEAVDAAEAEVTKASEVLAAWSWLRFSDRLTGSPARAGIGRDGFRDIRARLAELDPTLVEQQEADRAAEAAENARLFAQRGM